MTSHPLDETQLKSILQKIEQAAAERKLSPGAVQNLRRWLTEPPYRPYVPGIVQRAEAGRWEELDALFWEVIPFGTGGRRGRMAEFGSATINERTIAESAHGLAVYLKRWKEKAAKTGSTTEGGEEPGTAVVAHDTRHRSDEFARLTATTLAAHGLRVYFFEAHRATPELSFAVRHLGCDVGVMISASHNPPSDNGFKAYWSNGGQVLPPHDAGIIQCVYEAGEIPTVDFQQAVSEGRIQLIGEDVDRAYREAVKSLSLSPARDIRGIFTPLHGVGETSVFRVLHEAGFESVTIFEPQREPNGDFPNVPGHLPNPERPEVFEPILPQAEEKGADVILASDPDADRIAAMARDKSGTYRYLTGNRIGSLLADYILRKRSAAGELTPAHYVVETLVTTPLIAAIGRAHGVRVIDNLLVGFKYIGQTMDREGPQHFVFGAEESLGFLAGQYARDKDAAIGALYLLESAAELKTAGKTLWDRLDELFLEHGYHTEGQFSKICPGSEGQRQIERLMQLFRTAPPTSFGGIPLVQVRDYQQHEIRSLPDNARLEELPEPDGNLLFFESAEADPHYRLAVRPSGTEPKIKFYLFVRQPCDSAGQLPAVKEKADRFLSVLQAELTEWMEVQLQEAGR